MTTALPRCQLTLEPVFQQLTEALARTSPVVLRTWFRYHSFEIDLGVSMIFPDDDIAASNGEVVYR